VGGSEKSRMMVVCVVNYPSSSIRGVAFHKVVRRYYSGDAGANKKIYDVKFPQDFVHQKLLKSINFSRIYSKYRQGDVFRQCTCRQGALVMTLAML